MGKRGNWLSAIKRVFTSNSKDKPLNVVENKSSNEKKKLKHGDSRSFNIPLFRETSSIEKILGEIDQQNFFMEQPQPSFSGRPRVASPKAPHPPRIFSHRHTYRPDPTLGHHHLSATKIQAAFRGYMARRSFRGLRGLVRLQGVVRGQNVKRQTVNAMKQMQLLVRVQTQIQSRRIQMLENQPKNDKEVESLLGKWTFNNLSEIGDEHWDGSLITKEEREARLQRKIEAIMKRERAIAYAYSHQLWKATPKSAKNALTDIRSGGFPWWWNWLERQMPSDSEPTKLTPRATPPRRSPRPESSSGYKQKLQISSSPRSTTHVPIKTTPTRTPPFNLTKAKAKRVASPYPTKDDDSLMSCPPFSVPNYMSPTLSAKAKLKPTTTSSKEGFSSTPARATHESSKRRFSFPLAQTFRWNKPKDSPHKLLDDHKSPRSIGNFSIDSALSMPATVGRKPFNRFV